jgi:RNA polymerase sigma factor FliA
VEHLLARFGEIPKLELELAMVLTSPVLPSPIPAPFPVTPDAVLEEFQPLVRAIAAHLSKSLPASVEFEDLVQWGQVGLLHAVSRYADNRNVKFATYAKFRIRGAMLDGLRELDWAPRHARAETRRRDAARARLETGNGRPPTESELAQELGMTLEQYRERQMQAPPQLVSMNRSKAVEGESDWDRPAEQPTPLDFAMSGQLTERLGAAMALLSERDRVVLHSYFWDSKTMAEIAVQLGVNESRVCQLRKRAMERLKVLLRDEGIRDVA